MPLISAVPFSRCVFACAARYMMQAIPLPFLAVLGIANLALAVLVWAHGRLHVGDCSSPFSTAPPTWESVGLVGIAVWGSCMVSHDCPHPVPCMVRQQTWRQSRRRQSLSNPPRPSLERSIACLRRFVDSLTGFTLMAVYFL